MIAKLTTSALANILRDILHDKEELAKLKGEPFNGVSQDDVTFELKKRIGDTWSLVKETPVKLTKEDVAAVANNRFFRQDGKRLMMVWAIVVVLFAMSALTFKVLPVWAYYTLSIGATIFFLYYYSKKQKIIRDELEQAAGIR